MEDNVYQELTKKYGGSQSGPDTIERREWLRERWRRTYAEAAGLPHLERTPHTVTGS